MSRTRNDEADSSDELGVGTRPMGSMLADGRSFSGRERHCVFLNTGADERAGGRMATVSAVTGLDLGDDGRALAPVDWDGDGDLDLWISNRNAPRLRYLRNDMESGNRFLALRLRGDGKKTNRDAIGARVEVWGEGSGFGVQVSGESAQKPGAKSLEPEALAPLIRTVRAGEGFLTQGTRWLHFGLGADGVVTRVVVRWPDGREQIFTDLRADARYEIKQGSAPRRIESPKRAPMASSAPEPAPAAGAARIALLHPVELPPLTYRSFDGHTIPLPLGKGAPTLVTLWSSSCAPCLKEMAEFRDAADSIRSAGLQLAALSVDQLDPATADREGADERVIKRLNYPFPAGRAQRETVALLQSVRNKLTLLNQPLTVPAGFLFDADGRLSVIYLGHVPLETILADLAHARKPPLERLAGSAMAPGRVVDNDRTRATLLRDETAFRIGLGQAWQRNHPRDAEREYRRVLEIVPGHVMALNNLGFLLLQQERRDEARALLERATSIQPGYVMGQLNLGVVNLDDKRFDDAEARFRLVLELRPEHTLAHRFMGDLRMKQERFSDALPHLQKVVEKRPDARSLHELARALHLGGRAAEAAGHLRRAVKLDPRHAPSHQMLGTLAFERGALREAEQHFALALMADPNLQDARRSLKKVRAKIGGTP